MSERIESRVKVINKEGEWGYIYKIDPNHSRDYAFYPNCLSKSSKLDFDNLEHEIKVSFILEESNDRFKALNIEVVNDVSSEPEPELEPEASSSTSKNTNDSTKSYLSGESNINDSDLIIGIVSAVGTRSESVISPLTNRLKQFGYIVKNIKVSDLLNPNKDIKFDSEEERITKYIKEGDKRRKDSKKNSILAAGAVKLIDAARDKDTKIAFIIDSLKHPDEVEFLRKVYGHGFYLIGIHADKERREEYLVDERGCKEEGSAARLIEIDESEGFKHGQRTRDTYHLSDFFIYLGKDSDRVGNTLQRFLELVFSNPYLNPTFDEYAMFMAFNSSVRSGDLSRQVGAVLSKHQQILATGANDVPKAGGGLYWAEDIGNSGKIADVPDGKDYTRGSDSNKMTQINIVDDIIKLLKTNCDYIKLDPTQEKDVKDILLGSKIGDLTEFGRVVHAEMEAILSCSRKGISTDDTALYCTTFPCHNCAKHIIASGIKRVIYVEPYPKSKALEFHYDSIVLKTMDSNEPSGKVVFEPFIGVGPRRFLDLFSMNLGVGSKLKRKNEIGEILEWNLNSSSIRTPLVDKSYIDLEQCAIDIWNQHSDSFD